MEKNEFFQREKNLLKQQKAKTEQQQRKNAYQTLHISNHHSVSRDLSKVYVRIYSHYNKFTKVKQ